MASFLEPVGECFRGRPRPSCARFWLVEAGARYRLAPEDEYTDEQDYRVTKVVIAIGRMENRTDRTARGAVGFLITDLDEESRVGVAIRRRRWVGRAVALDFGAGPSIAVADSGGVAGKVGFLLEAGVSAGDWIVLFGQVELVPKVHHYANGGVQLFIGARAGSYVGVAGVVATFVGRAFVALTN